MCILCEPQVCMNHCATCNSMIHVLCSACHNCHECCTCQECQACQEKHLPDNLCPTCSACDDCCECHSCNNCDRPHKPEDICDNCDYCAECCACISCDHCGARFDGSDICRFCSCCERHCECSVCAGCDNAVDCLCDDCNYCTDSCCECWYCESCNESHSRYTERCRDCDACTYGCTCSIASYHTKVTHTLKALGKADAKLRLGIEIEVECKRGEPQDSAQEWLQAAPDFVICKRDGSLDRGFEIVSCPASLAVHQERWPQYLSNPALRHGLVSWKTTTCGLHVHVSKAALSQLDIGKILVFINSPLTRRKITALAGRESAQWAKFAQKTVGDVKRNHADRYQAINTQNPDTIEFRIFKGTLDSQHVLADLEFCHAVCFWAKQASVRDLESWDSFWRFVEAQRKQYSHLYDYMSNR